MQITCTYFSELNIQISNVSTLKTCYSDLKTTYHRWHRIVDKVCWQCSHWYTCQSSERPSPHKLGHQHQNKHQQILPHVLALSQSNIHIHDYNFRHEFIVWFLFNLKGRGDLCFFLFFLEIHFCQRHGVKNNLKALHV